MQYRVFALLALLALCCGCYRDNEAALDPCRTAPGSVHYADVSAVLNASGCLGCHAGAGAQGGVLLTPYTALKQVVDNGRLVGAISHAAGFAPMPQGGAKMNDCNISRIKAWIADGAHEH